MLSVVITAWNEEKSLPRAVASVKRFADEIVVIDTESTDSTVAVAKKLGCKVYHHKNTGIVEPVRNFSTSKARGEWILLLDADEEVSIDLADKIQEVIKSQDSSDFYRLPRKNIIFGKWIRSSHWWPDYVYRLFKKGHVSWEDTIHSVPFTKGRGSDLENTENLALIHHHYSSVSQYVDRLNRYTDHQLSHLQKNGYNFSWKDLIDKPTSEFIRQYFSRAGYKDGLHGLALSLLQSFSETVLYLKAWQASGFLEVPVSPQDLSQAISQKKSESKWWYIQSQIDQSNLVKKIYLKLVRKLVIHAS